MLARIDLFYLKQVSINVVRQIRLLGAYHNPGRLLAQRDVKV